MTLNKIKSIAHDYLKQSRWATLRMTKDWLGPPDQARIIGIGRKYVRLMWNNGQVLAVPPEEITEVR